MAKKSHRPRMLGRSRSNSLSKTLRSRLFTGRSLGRHKRARDASVLTFEKLEPRALLATTPVITEFLASNNSVLADGDGNFSDWIEVHNPAAATFDLAGWHLTDDSGNLQKWEFPSLAQSVLDPGETLVVFASSQPVGNYVDAGGNLHANFALGRTGEYVALSDAAAQVQSEFGQAGAFYPEQYVDISYGLAADLATPQYFSLPTPGAENNLGTAFHPIVINELHYDPPDETVPAEFIELYNAGAAAIDLSGWFFDGVDYVIPNNTILAANSYLVVAQNPATIASTFGVTAIGPWTGRLANEGEAVRLYDAEATLIDQVDYQLGFPWPTVGEFGSSIELIHADLDNDLAGSWRASNGDAGLPDNPITLLAQQDNNWRYRKGTSEASDPIDAWRLPGFVEDASWLTGQTSIGYGDGDDNTIVADMRNNYTSLYLRNEFTIAGSVPSRLQLGVYVDDGAVVWINGHRVGLFHVEDQELEYDDLAFNHDASGYEQLTLLNVEEYLTVGENTIAVHVLNSSISSSDLSIDAEVIIPAAGSTLGEPTPGGVNSVFNVNAAPQLRQLQQSVQQPASGEDVVISIKATDPDGVQSLALDYQLVDPGNYIRITDAAYDTNWTTVAMVDNGAGGDAVAGDDIYSVTIPGALHTHRRLVRYRITATDSLGASITGPFNDDPQPNFAYFVYDGVPDYTASLRPGFQPNVTYAGATLDDMATYHLIANSSDVDNSQYNGAFNLVQFRGTLVYQGIVYDHIEFRNRGRASTYQVGKNKWKLNFLRGHGFQARDNYGNLYNETWDKINILPGTNPWWRDNVSTEGTVLFEPVAFRLYELLGTPAPHTQYFQFRVVDNASESGGSDQYGGDFWGLYIGIEQPDGRFLNERLLPDGNIFNMHGGTFGATTQRSQGSMLPTNRSDLSAFLSGIDGGFETLQWWEDNLNFDSYFAWNIGNHIVNNSDIRPNENVNYYHNQETGQWYTVPWDLDLTFEDAPHLGNPVTNRENIRSVLAQHPSVRIEYENRIRHLKSLLFDNDDAARVVEEYANILTLGSPGHSDLTILESNQAQWDFHPRKNKKGIWYENFNPSLLPSETFAGLVEYMQDFVSPGGYGYNLVDGQGDDANIPDRPTISYIGSAGFPINGLSFQTSSFSHSQGGASFGAIEWRVAEVHNSSVANYDPARPYVYEVEGTWDSGTLLSFENSVDVPTNALQQGNTYRARVRMQDDAGRWSYWSDAIEFVADNPTGTVPASSANLAIVELHYNPSAPTAAEIGAGYVDSDDFEFIELRNISSSAVDLTGTQFVQVDVSGSTEGVSFAFSGSGVTLLQPGESVVIVEDDDAFQFRYGLGANVAGQWSGGLDNASERITLRSERGTIIQQFDYSDSGKWPSRADGQGASLEIIDPLADFNDPENWRSSNEFNGSPGVVGTGPLFDVVINEVLSHSGGGTLDQIELYNVTGAPIDLEGWHLSDTSSDYFRYTFGNGASIGAGQYLVLNENNLGFALDGLLGDQVWLMQGDPNNGGKLLRFADGFAFDAAAENVSLGRVPNADPTAQGASLFPMTSQTFGGANGSFVEGPAVISEIMFDPAPVPPAEAGNISVDELEYVEIYNDSGSLLDLSDWRLNLLGAGDLILPVGTTMSAGGTLLLVAFDPLLETAKAAAFRSVYDLHGSVLLVGSYAHPLDNAGEPVELLRPVDPVNPSTGYVLVDRVAYDDAAPWPTTADGTGNAIHRSAPGSFGNFATSWAAGAATPGDVPYSSAASADFNGDSDVDGADFLAWQRGFGLAAPDAAKAHGDADNDMDVDALDLNFWEMQFGASIPAIAAASAPGANEPANSEPEAFSAEQRNTTVDASARVSRRSRLTLPYSLTNRSSSALPASNAITRARDMAFADELLRVTKAAATTTANTRIAANTHSVDEALAALADNASVGQRGWKAVSLVGVREGLRAQLLASPNLMTN